MDYKTGKLLNIVRQFDKSNGKYEINGIDVGEAVFLYRKKSEMFMPIPKGNYNITKENNNTFLNVDNVINDKAIEYQIIYETSIKSSEYKDPYPELKILVQKYNEAVLDIFNISKSIKTVGVKIDSKYQTQILTPLEPSSTWYMNSNGIIDTLPLDDFNKKFKEIIEKIRDTADEKAQEQVIKRLETLKEEIETFKNTKTSEILEKIEKKVDDSLKEIENIINTTKNELNYGILSINNKSSEALESIKNIKETYIDEITKISNSSKQELESKMPEINNKFNENILHATGKEYGGILNNAGNKIAGKTYFDNNTKKLFLCKKENSDISANTENFVAIDNNSNYERLENFIHLKKEVKVIFNGKIKDFKRTILNENWEMLYITHSVDDNFSSEYAYSFSIPRVNLEISKKITVYEIWGSGDDYFNLVYDNKTRSLEAKLLISNNDVVISVY